MRAHAESIRDLPELRAALWPSAWVLFVLFNLGICALDWSLRDHASGVQPMPGGLPDWAEYFVVLSPCALGVSVVFAMPIRWALWVRVLLATLQFIIAYAGLFIFHICYVVISGIDTI